MTLEVLKKFATEADVPPKPPHLRAMWHDAKGNWNAAHEMVQQLSDPLAHHIHAYLHRKEGDVSNSKYWYSRSGIAYDGTKSFDQEAEEILISANQELNRK
jgi:hypothetical protein